MKKEFISAVERHELAIVRMMLSNELLLDPRGKTFAEMLVYAKDNLDDLFEVNQPSRFDIPSDKNFWDDNIVSKVKRDLNLNFSVEKLALFEEMAKWIGKNKANKLEQKEREDSYTNGRKNNSRQSGGEYQQQKKNGSKATETIIIGSGAALTITGLCVDCTILTIIGGVVAVAGVVLLVKSK